MHFGKSDLQQLTPEYIDRLPSERRAALIEELRQDLIAAYERLNQNPTNSSRPPSSQAPWVRSNESDEEDCSEDGDQTEETQQGPLSDVQNSVEDGADQENKKEPPDPAGANSQTASSSSPRKRGKQPGAKGFGRTQKLDVTHTVIHRPQQCHGCGHAFTADSPFELTGGHYVIDLEEPVPGKIGINGTYTKHVFGKTLCSCGFSTQTKPHKAAPDNDWSVEMSEWKLIGPRLVAFIVFAKLRLHLTVGKTRLLLMRWWGIRLSDGAIATVLLEAGRAAASVEPELIQALKASSILLVDETSWKEHHVTRWMWAAVGEQAVYFTVGPRSKEMAENILNGFAGTLMSDGYGAYRFFADRARCWAHLKRKAQGLSESWHQEAAAFGRVALKAWNVLIRLVHKMRELPAERREVVCRAAERVEALLLYHCLKQKDASHEATKAFCTEMTRDAPAIFAVLKRPELPLTNNGAERALRPLVIMRKISYGSKSQEGARSIALLASVEATLARQGRDAWHFYRDLLAACRAGQSPPTLIFSSA